MSNDPKIETDVIFDDPAWASENVDEALVQRAAIALWARVAEKGETSEMSVLMTSDNRVRDLNTQFRGKDQSTNVLSFPSGDDEYIGDIALGAETVVREAAELKVSVADHVVHLVIHGTLHLLGYDHQNDNEAVEMEQLEVSVLEGLGIANPYEGRDLSNVELSSVISGKDL